jgi:hypothetical protein
MRVDGSTDPRHACDDAPPVVYEDGDLPATPQGGAGAGMQGGSGTGGTGGSSLQNDPSVCVTYEDEQSDLSPCGVPGGGLDCGQQFSCVGICNQAPSCFPRANCCADSCSAWGGTTWCGTVGHLNDMDQTEVSCDQGFAQHLVYGCDPQTGVCCNSTAPGAMCPAGTSCAALDGGGYCCSSTRECSGGGPCSAGQLYEGRCCAGYICSAEGYCRSPDFECTAFGGPCVNGSTNCCVGLTCIIQSFNEGVCLTSGGVPP